MLKIKFFIALCMVGSLLVGGCASVRVTTDLKPQTDPKLKSADGMFYIAGLKYRDEGSGREGVSAWDVAYEKKLLLHLRKACPVQYPLLFTEEEKLAIPLYVTLTDAIDLHQPRRVVWMLCTLMITPVILPMPSMVEHDLTVSVSASKVTAGEGSTEDRKKFRREVHAWETLFTPLGLITVPGESDFPKESKASDYEPVLMRWSYDYEQVAQQMATALAKVIVSKELDFWKDTLRPAQKQGHSAAGATDAPVASPVPTDSPTPF